MSSEHEIPEMSAQQGPPPAPPPPVDGGEFEAGSANSGGPGAGQSKSSRRRRRKRKGKGGESAGAANTEQSGDASGAGEGMALEASVETPTSASQAASRGSAPSSNGGGFQAAGQANGASTKRWKKKFRDRDRPRPSDNPGNQAGPRENGFANGGGGSNDGNGHGGGSVSRDTGSHQFGNRADSFRRKSGGGGGGGKQSHRERSPRSFVGPMDHSYRAVNSEFAGGSPSTIESHNFGRRPTLHTGDSQPIDYSQGRAVPIPEGAPTKILFFIEDLFFLAKITETSRKLGVKVAFVKSADKEAIAALLASEEEDRPALIVFDLNNAAAKPLTLIPKLKAKLKRSTSVIGFLSHLQGDLKAKATEAGCDTVMPRAAFSQNLPNLLRRYGLEQEEESNFNY